MINHLDRYLQELGANELLLQIIIVRPWLPLLSLIITNHACVGLDDGLGLQNADRVREVLHRSHQNECKEKRDDHRYS